jgi:hypothetical protein
MGLDVRTTMDDGKLRLVERDVDLSGSTLYLAVGWYCWFVRLYHVQWQDY